jgi:hypothetical protein
MDPVTMIVTALASGAALGVSDAASAAVMDAYGELKALVRRRLAGRPAAEAVLARHASDPAAWREPLIAELSRCEAGDDDDLVAAARVVLGLTGAAARGGKYVVDARGAQGVQIGDRNQQDNVFGQGDALAVPGGRISGDG